MNRRNCLNPFNLSVARALSGEGMTLSSALNRFFNLANKLKNLESWRAVITQMIQLLVLCLFMPNAFSGVVDFYFQQSLSQQMSFAKQGTVHSDTFPQPIDRNYFFSGTFPQRYYYDETYGPEDDAPVFFYICGESACHSGVLDGAIRYYAKKFHAKLIALEHRYYGLSQPYPSLSVKNLRHLTTEEALYDLANFQQKISVVKQWTGKWVAFGGSYPGSLAAYFRMRYPDRVAGALASSAPVMAKENFYEYDQHVTKVTGVACSEKMRLVVGEIEQAIAQEDDVRLLQIKQMFGAEEVNHPVDFLYLVADVGAGAVQYGMHDEFCASLQEHSDPIAGYAEFAKRLLSRWNVTATDLTPAGAVSENANDYAKAIGLRQWYYQTCTEYGYWQIASSDPQSSTRSALIDLDYHHEVCERLFGFKAPPKTETTNKHFYWPLFDHSVSRIYFTNGSNDPWSYLSLSEQNGNALNPNLNYTLIDGAAHCNDLRMPLPTDSPALQATREQFETQLHDWLDVNGP